MTARTITTVIEHLEVVEHQVAGVDPETWRADPCALATATTKAIGIARELSETFDAIAKPGGAT